MIKATKATKPTKSQKSHLSIIDDNPAVISIHDGLSALEVYLSEGNYPSEIAAEVLGIAKDLGGRRATNLTSTDFSQLRELADVSYRIHTVTKRLPAILEEDPKLWATVVSKLQNDSSLRRGLLRDLKATRNAREASNKTNDEPELNSWTGTI